MTHAQEYRTRLQWFLEVEGHEMMPGLVSALRYFVEREPLVQELVASELDPEHEGCTQCALAKSVRNFEVKR